MLASFGGIQALAERTAFPWIPLAPDLRLNRVGTRATSPAATRPTAAHHNRNHFALNRVFQEVEQLYSKKVARASLLVDLIVVAASHKLRINHEPCLRGLCCQHSLQIEPLKKHEGTENSGLDLRVANLSPNL
jgi:hypothetical protein